MTLLPVSTSLSFDKRRKWAKKAVSGSVRCFGTEASPRATNIDVVLIALQKNSSIYSIIRAY